MQFGHGQTDFFVDIPEAPAQAILTRLKLFTGEWFLNIDAGTAWVAQGFLPGATGPFYGVLGAHTEGIRDQILQDRIRNTPGVLAILGYSSIFDPGRRHLVVSATVMTIYGPAPVRLILPAVPPAPAPAPTPFIVATDPGQSQLDGPDLLLANLPGETTTTLAQQETKPWPRPPAATSRQPRRLPPPRSR